MVIPSHYAVALATVIREAAEAAGYNPTSVAAEIHRPRNTIKESLAGTRAFNVADAHAIASLLGRSLAEFAEAADQRVAA